MAGLMIPAARITRWGEQVAEARLTIQGMELTELGGVSCSPLPPPYAEGQIWGISSHCPPLLQTLIVS